MKKVLFPLVVLCCININTYCQRIISYNLFNGSVDTLNRVDYDTTIERENTDYFIGNFSDEINDLREEVPFDDVFPNSNYTRKKQASLDYDLNKFPIRTSLRMFRIKNDSLKSCCSGSMISRRHVLTASHCVAEDINYTLKHDSLLVCPVYDNGVENDNFECSRVKKVYVLENWDVWKSDFSILELEDPIGDETGWISIGFESNDSLFLDGIFYKFSYPAITLFALDSNSYNGDTLYCSYGVADWVDYKYFGVNNATGIPGESGSSMIKVKKDEVYTSYGVFSFSSRYSHSKLRDSIYFGIKSIISDDLYIGEEEIVRENDFYVFPVPVNDLLNVKYTGTGNLTKLILYDLNGRSIIAKTGISNSMQLDLSSLIDGSYILIMFTNDYYVIKKIVKANSY